MGWHWLIDLYRFEVYNSMIIDVCILHCVPTTQSQILFHHHIFAPFSLYYPTPLPSGNYHTGVCVYEFSVFLFVCLFVAFSFISHIWVKSYGSFSVWLTLLSMMFSRSIHIVAYISTSFLFMLNNTLLYGYTIVFIHSLVDGHLGCFYFVDIKKMLL